jgi:hypothetical protein
LRRAPKRKRAEVASNLEDEREALMGDLGEIVDERDEIAGILVALGADPFEVARKLEESFAQEAR